MRAEGVVCAGYGEGARGSVFQTGFPSRQESGGLKTPAMAGPFRRRGCILRENLGGVLRGDGFARMRWRGIAYR